MPSNKTPKKSSPVGNEDIGCKSASKSATKGNYELGLFFFGNENTKACSFSASKNGNSNDNPISSFVKSKNQDAFIKTLEDNGMKVVNGPGKSKTPVSAKKSSRSSGENAEVGSPANNLKISDFLKNKVREPQSRTPKPSTTSVSGGTPTNNRSQFMKSVSSTLSGNNTRVTFFFLPNYNQYLIYFFFLFQGRPVFIKLILVVLAPLNRPLELVPKILMEVDVLVDRPIKS